MFRRKHKESREAESLAPTPAGGHHLRVFGSTLAARSAPNLDAGSDVSSIAPGLPPAPMPTSGRPGHLTPGQQATLDSFRAKAVASHLYDPTRHDDACLCRFLRARKWDLDAAWAMFSDAEQWRREFKVDELYESFEFPEKQAVDELYPQFYHKTDKDGRPVYIEQLGKVDLKALAKVTTPERILQKLVVEYEKFQRERLPVCSAEHGELIETSCTIMDLKNVGVSQFWNVSSYVQQASKIGQYYYPETMGKFYIINAPYIFTTVWSVVKGWLDPVTVDKIKILGKGYERELASQIPQLNLPAYLGGKCKCAQGCSLSDAGPWTSLRGESIIKQARSEGAQKQQLFQQAGSNAEAAATVAKLPLYPSLSSASASGGSVGSSTVGAGSELKAAPPVAPQVLVQAPGGETGPIQAP